MKQQAPKGTQDLLPEVTLNWQYVERTFEDLCKLYGYEEIRIPTFEHSEVFQRGVGETTDVVQKEMYTFEDKGGRSLTLRPEGTAGVVRAYVENGMGSKTSPQRLFYVITAFRYENVQKGRYREFHQMGVEAFGAKGPHIDAEVLAMLDHYFEELGLKDYALHINSIGCPNCRAQYREALLAYLRPKKDQLCQDCQNRMEENPLRVLDCKEKSCQDVTKDAPLILDYLDEECKDHFDTLKGLLDDMGISYKVDPRIVRGLDYYTKTVFEFVSENVGTQGTICGGGRYDGLVEALGGPSTPGIGFAMGEERLLMELEAQGLVKPHSLETTLYIANLNDAAHTEAQALAQALRRRGISVQYDLMDRSLRAQMKYAGKNNMDYILVLGEDELARGKVMLRSLVDRDKEEVEVGLHDIDTLAEILAED